MILFGLSMDYHVFILSRIREAVDRGMSTDDAVAHGIKSTAGVVTSAAVVMVAVFAIFAHAERSIEFKQMGVGLAAAILIDATIVRAVLLPATMKLLGERNWYLPKRPAAGCRSSSTSGRRSRPRRSGTARYSRAACARMRRSPPSSSCPSPRAAGGSPRRAASQGDAICKRVNDQVAKEPDPTNAEDLAALAKKTVKISDPAIETWTRSSRASKKRRTSDRHRPTSSRRTSSRRQPQEAARPDQQIGEAAARATREDPAVATEAQKAQDEYQQAVGQDRLQGMRRG